MKVLILLSVFLLSACSSLDKQQASILDIAEHDLNCSKGKIELKSLGTIGNFGGKWGVKGCGKRATYESKCMGLGHAKSCKATINGNVNSY